MIQFFVWCIPQPWLDTLKETFWDI
jgi:hypothetical protein